MQRDRPKRLELRPYVESLWSSASVDDSKEVERVRVLPSGLMHLAFRLSDLPMRLTTDESGKNLIDYGHAALNGFRSTCYVKEVPISLISVGVVLRPAAIGCLFDCRANEVAECHTSLGDLWGNGANDAIQRLSQSREDERLDTLEEILLERLPRPVGVHPAIAHALKEFEHSHNRIAEVVRQSGYSHRRFIELFRRTVGVPPKTFCRVKRFQRTLKQLHSQSTSVSLCQLAVSAGYSDQAHFTRDFRHFAGMAPTEYLRRALKAVNTVPEPVSGVE